MSPQRRQLDPRRELETFRFDHGGVRYFASISRFPDGAIAELFLNAGRAGSALSTMARDAAVLTSITLQRGIPVQSLLEGLSRVDDKDMAGAVGVALAQAVALQ